MSAHQIILPQERGVIFEFREDGLPGVGVVNAALRELKPKHRFDWHLSVIIDCEEIAGNRMPSSREQVVLVEIEDLLSKKLQERGNSIFLARITHNGTRQLLWRVHDSANANKTLETLIANTKFARAFDFHMEQDRDWVYANRYLSIIK